MATPEAPVALSKGWSRSRAWWELSKVVGPEAAERWEAVLGRLLAMQPHLASPVLVDAKELEAPGGYRDAAPPGTVLSFGRSRRARLRSLALMGAGVVTWGLFATLDFGPLGVLAAVGSGLFATGLTTLALDRRPQRITIDGAMIRVESGGDGVEIHRDDVAYVEARDSEAAVPIDRLGHFERNAFRHEANPSAWICAVTHDGEVVPLGRPVDVATAAAVCMAIEDELGLLPDLERSTAVAVRVETAVDRSLDPVTVADSKGSAFEEHGA